MKSLLIVALLLIISSVNVAAQYIEGEDTTNVDDVMTITTMSVEEPRMCTMEYAPVCAQGESGSYQTYGNACGAGDNPVLFEGACSSYINDSSYEKYEPIRTKIEEVINKYNDQTLIKINDLIDQKIKMVTYSRIAVEMQQEKITKYAFIKSVISDRLSEK